MTNRIREKCPVRDLSIARLGIENRNQDSNSLLLKKAHFELWAWLNKKKAPKISQFSALQTCREEC
jgi:hypothetical protein